VTFGRSSRFGRLERAFVFSEDGVFAQLKKRSGERRDPTGLTFILLLESRHGGA
jgi:hypothetical protein